jgi:gliding motility-associated-like protein
MYCSKPYLRFVILIFGLLLGGQNVYSQACAVTGTATPDVLPCGGGLVNLNANGTGGTTFALDNDFNLGGAGAGWNVSPAGTFNNPCGASLDGSTYMWMGNTTAAPRTLQSAGLDVSCGGQICFDLKFSVQGGAAPCEGPDLATEGVFLQYSIDGGVTFVDINYFQPNTVTNAFTTWANFCFTIPVAAETANTSFQWYQGGSSGTCCDHWGIDNITITAQSCIGFVYNWTNTPAYPDPAAQNGVFVDNDTTFTVWYTNSVNDSCFVDVPVTVLGMGAPTVNTVDEICLGDNDGQITVTANGGTGPYTYDIAGPANQSNGTGLFTGLPPGIYSVDVTDNAACTVISTATLIIGMNCCPMTMTAASTDVTCNGGTDGTGTATQVGGAPGITYTWYDLAMTPIGQSTITATGLAAGQYIVEVTDATPCTIFDTITITEPTLVTFTEAIVNTTCGAANGSITITAAGGTAGYTYSIDGGATYVAGNALNSLMAATYDVWVQDAAGCTSNHNVIIVNAGAPGFTTVTFTDPLCNNSCDGTITITGNSGTAPYEYSVDGGVTYNPVNTFAGLCALPFSVWIRDANLCTHDTIITLVDPPVMSYTAAVVSNPCAADCMGTITITALGGDANYQYSDNNGITFQASNQFTALCANNYNIVVADGNNCQAAGVEVVTEPTQLVLVATTTNNTCNNSCDGLVIALPVGGTEVNGYQYVWTGTSPGNIGVAPNLCAANYDLTVTDDNGCFLDTSFTITEPTPFTVASSSLNSNCNLPDGSATIDNVTGSNGTYSYTWDASANNQVTANAANLIPGSYDVTIQDVSGCDTVISVVVGNTPGNVAQQVAVVDATCNAGSDGTAEVSSINGTAPYTYQWDANAANQTGATASNLGAGSYTCVITDASGCADQITLIVAEPTLVVAATSPDTIICIGGTATLVGSATGGSGTYSYVWDDPNNTNTQSANVMPGGITVYTVIASDINDCPSAAVPVVVDLYPPLQLTALSDADICPGFEASISGIAQGGDGGPYTYSWDQGLAVGQLHNVSPAGTTVYTVTVTDGCTTPAVSDMVTITVNPTPIVSFIADVVEGCTPVIPTFANTTDPAMVGSNCLWDFGDGTFDSNCAGIAHQYDAPGCYDVSLTVTSPESCVGFETYTNYVCVYAYPIPDFVFGPQPTSIMQPEITFANGTQETGTGTHAYNWTFDEWGVSTDINPVFEFPSDDQGTYEVCLQAISPEGCSADTCYEVVIDGQFTIYVPNAFSPDNDGVNDYFFPEGKGLYGDDYTLMIFDRWGEMIYQSNHESTPWDGTKNGSPVKSDLYVWKIITTDRYSGTKKEFIGHVTLLR